MTRWFLCNTDYALCKANYNIRCIPSHLLKGVGSTTILNSSPPSATFMRQWIGSAFIPVMASRLIGLLSIRPLGTKFRIISIKIKKRWSTKMYLKISSAKYGHFVHGWNELNSAPQEICTRFVFCCTLLELFYPYARWSVVNAWVTLM